MDNPRGSFVDYSDPLEDRDDDVDAAEDEIGAEAPPAAIGTDERRMQVRAYNHWASLLDNRNLPSIEDLEPEALPDFGPFSVLLDFTSGIENPGISYLGADLAAECGLDSEEVTQLDDVPSRSLLSRITDHYMQILANQAPIGFEAEFVNQRGITILYRGILLPFSTDDDTIDFIYGVINWKELADQKTADELLLEIDQALEEPAAEDDVEPVGEPDVRRDTSLLNNWADGPDAAESADPGAHTTQTQTVTATPHFDLPKPSFAENLMRSVGDDEAANDETGTDDDWDSDEPVAESPLASLINPIAKKKPLDLGPAPEADDADEQGVFGDEVQEQAQEDEEPFGSILPEAPDEPAPELETEPHMLAAVDDEPDSHASDEALGTSPAEQPLETTNGPVVEPDPVSESTPIQIDAPAIDESEMALGDWLASARDLAQAAQASEERTRSALYDAIGRAYDFSLAALDAPEEFAELVEDYGLTMQDRAPMTPVVKLVFGADYDKTRLTEYAAALSHAHRLELARGSLSDYLAGAEGGLKGIINAERRLRREEAGKPQRAVQGIGARLAKKLRTIEPQQLSAVDPVGEEFGVVVIRRMPDGSIAVLGEVADDPKLVERAARKLTA